jgi:hypothetical protein
MRVLIQEVHQLLHLQVYQNKMRKNKILIFGMVLLVLLLNLNFVLGLGVTPGRSTVNFEPGLERSFDFKIVNSDQQDLKLNIYLKGDEEIINFITLQDEYVNLKYNELEAFSSFKVKLPEEMSPGEHNVDIFVVQTDADPESGSQASLGALAAVSTQLRVNVPYPGKYLEGALNVVGDGSEDMLFSIPVINKGTSDISRAGVQLDIYSSLNKKVASLDSEEIEILGGERKEFIIKWDPAGMTPGPYRAVASIVYDAGVLELEKDFDIGKKYLELQGVEVNDFRLGDIVKMEMLVENYWSEPMVGAFVVVSLLDDRGRVIDDFKTSSYDVDSSTKETILGFWDTSGVSKGVYNATIDLNYAGKEDRYYFKLDVGLNDIKIFGIGHIIAKEGKSSDDSLLLVIAIGVIILILINVLFVVYFMRRRGK